MHALFPLLTPSSFIHISILTRNLKERVSPYSEECFVCVGREMSGLKVVDRRHRFHVKCTIWAWPLLQVPKQWLKYLSRNICWHDRLVDNKFNFLPSNYVSFSFVYLTLGHLSPCAQHILPHPIPNVYVCDEYSSRCSFSYSWP